MLNDEKTPKGKEEIMTDLKEEFGDLDDATMEKLINRELKHQENLGTAIKQKKSQRTKAEELAKILKENGIELDGEGKPTKKKDAKKDDLNIDPFDLHRYISTGGTRTGLRQIQYIMKAKGCDFNTARNSGLYKAWEKDNEKYIKDIKSQLPPSRGGGPADKGDAPMTDKDKNFLQGLGVDPKKVKKDK